MTPGAPPPSPESALARGLAWMLGHPVVYNAIQIAVGAHQTHRRLSRLLAGTDGLTVLDVGAGTGLVAPLLPAGAHYLWLDNDLRKLRGFRPGRSRVSCMLGDGTRLGLRDRSVDVGVCVAVSHHLTDSQLDGVLGELARVVRQRLVFMDAIDRPESLVSRTLWRFDQGRYPRTASVLEAALARHFDVTMVDRYTVYHSYVLCVGTPRPRAG